MITEIYFSGHAVWDLTYKNKLVGTPYSYLSCIAFHLIICPKIYWFKCNICASSILHIFCYLLKRIC